MPPPFGHSCGRFAPSTALRPPMMYVARLAVADVQTSNWVRRLHVAFLPSTHEGLPTSDCKVSERVPGHIETLEQFL